MQKETISLSIVGIDGEKSLHDGTYLEKEGCTEWRFAYEPGVLKAVCGEAECSIQTAGKAVELSANVWHAGKTINKEEVMQIEVSLTDENGVLAAEDLEITAEVIGGTLLGLENGDNAILRVTQKDTQWQIDCLCKAKGRSKGMHQLPGIR